MQDPLDLETLPTRIPARLDLLAKLGEFFRPLATGHASVDVQVVGPTGTGKSTLVRTFLLGLQMALGWQDGRLDVTRITCRPGMRISGAVGSVLRTFCPHYPTKGFSEKTILADLAQLVKARGTHLVLALDDLHCMRDAAALMATLDTLRTEHKLGLSIIAVGERPQTGPHPFAILNVPPYTSREALEVISFRALECGVGHVFSRGALEAVASVGSQQGMKPAILGLRACRDMLQTKPSINKLDAVHILRLIHSRFNWVRLDALTDHHLMILRAAACAPSTPIRSRRLREAYELEAQSRHEKPLANVQFLKYVDQMTRSGFLDTKPLRGDGPGGALAVTLLCPAALALTEVDKALDSRGA